MIRLHARHTLTPPHPHPHAGTRGTGRGAALALIVLAAFAAPGCMPLPQQNGVAVSTGPLSDQWVVDWDPATRTPVNMTNRSLQQENPRENPPISDQAAEAAVRGVFTEYRDWFRMRPGVDDIRVVRSYAQDWLHFLRIAQTYKGVPVAGAGYDVRVLSGGRVGSLEGHFYPDIEMVVNPVLSAAQADERAQSLVAGGLSAPSLPSLQLENENGFQEPHVLVILPRSTQYLLAWGVLVQTPPNGSSRVYIDATSGNPLGVQVISTDWRR
jgi:hypothetical protein